VSDLAGSGAGEGFGVSRIFLSHSSAENRAAAALKRRLAAQRPETGQRDDLPRHRPGFRAAAGGLGGSASCSRAPPAVRFNTAALYQSEPEKVQP